MTKIVLDANIIISHPKLLGLSVKDIQFVVPLDVITELNERASLRGLSYDDRVELIEKGNLEGTISIINTDLPLYRKYHEDMKSYLATGTDISVIAVALTLKNKGEEVKVATSDKIVNKIANDNDLIVLTKSEIEKFIDSFKKPESKNTFLKILYDVLLEIAEQIFTATPIFGSILIPIFKRLRASEFPSIQGKIVFFERKETTNLIAGIVIGILITLLSALIYLRLDIIIGSINIWGTIALTLVLGIILFIVREKQRLAYGVFEFLVGVSSIILLFNSQKFNYSKIDFTADFYIKIAAGLYIMVRGQDNIVKAIKDSKLGYKLKKYGIGN